MPKRKDYPDYPTLEQAELDELADGDVVVTPDGKRGVYVKGVGFRNA